MLALSTALFSGIANFTNKFALKAVGDPLVHTTVKNSLVALMVVSSLVLLGKLPKIRKLSRNDLLLLLTIGIVGGSLPFYLFFSALAKMPAINAALIHKTLIFWVVLLAVPFLKERISKVQVAALGIIFSANLLLGGFKGFAFTRPELMVLVATMLWAVENVIAKVVLKRVDPDIVVAARMGIGSLIMLSAVGLSGKTSIVLNLSVSQLGIVAVTSVLLFGYVSTWYRALRVAPVTFVATVLTLATLITNGLSAVFVTGTFPVEVFLQFVLVSVGLSVFLLATRKLLSPEQIKLRLSP